MINNTKITSNLKKNKKNYKKIYYEYLRFSKKIVPFLEVLWELRIPAFTALLSFIFFSAIDQTLEVYQVFALNPLPKIFQIFCSFLLVLVLAFFIWYSGFVISENIKSKNIKPEKIKNELQVPQKQGESEKDSDLKIFSYVFLVIAVSGLIYSCYLFSQKLVWFPWIIISIIWILFCCFSFSVTKRDTKLKWNSRVFGVLPLFIFGWGLYLDINNLDIKEEESESAAFVLISIILAFFFCFSVTKIGNSRDTAQKWFPRLLGLAPLLSLCYGLYRKCLIDHADGLVMPLVFGIIISLIFTIFYWRITKILPTISSSNFSINSPYGTFTLISLITIVFIFFIPLINNRVIALIVTFCLYGVIGFFILVIKNNNKIYRVLFFLFAPIYYILPSAVIPSLLGPFSIIAIFLILFVFFGSFISYWGNEKKIPVIGILMTLAIILSLIDVNDNHHLRELESTRPPTITSLNNSFESWIKEKDRESEILRFYKAQNTANKEANDKEPKIKAPDKRYPVYIVSAQGGGIFAAYQAAMTLSQLQDSCPDFASHVFAISSVSGGSLGAAVFSSLIKANPNPHPPSSKDCFPQKTPEVLETKAGVLETKASKLLDKDFLSPLLAGGLFPDLFARFIPNFFNLLNDFDRARGLDKAFEQAWNETDEITNFFIDKKTNPLKASYYEHWEPKEEDIDKKRAPALVLNTTVVETGERLVISPFKIDLPNLKDITTFASCDKNIDFPLSTAAILSARFPFVTPVGWFNRCDIVKDKNNNIVKDKDNNDKKVYRKTRLADGGYFENSGVSTAVDIGSRLEETLRNKIKLNKCIDASDKTVIDKCIDASDQTVKVVYLAITDKHPSEIPKAGGLNELLSPIKALWNSRDARGLSVVAQAEYLLDAFKADHEYSIKNFFQRYYTSHRFRQFYLHNQKLTNCSTFDQLNLDKPLSKNCTVQPERKFQLPLGWFLSHNSQDIIKNQIRVYKTDKDCPDNLTEGTNNQCVFRSIREELTLP
jgi:hypothetical protein